MDPVRRRLVQKQRQTGGRGGPPSHPMAWVRVQGSTHDRDGDHKRPIWEGAFRVVARYHAGVLMPSVVGLPSG